MTASEPAPSEPPVAVSSPRARMSSRDLFRGGREIVILHAGQEYLLRITRTDKLILTK